MIGQSTDRVRTFNAAKALAAISYLVKATDADLYSVMKMLYIADKTHLGRFGRTVTGDEFTAMSKGPVPEGSYGLCKFIRGEKAYFDAMPDARERVQLNENNFVFLSEPDLDELSVSDSRALDHAAQIYIADGWKGVKAASHDGAWEAAWAEAQSRGKGSIAIDFNAIAATLPNGPALIEFLADPHPGEAECATAENAEA